MSKRPGALRIGISGWRYPAWRGVFYPKGLPQRAELEYAASRMNSAEINGSFYSLQHAASWQAWHAQTPEDFIFAVKGPRYVTHMLKLRNARTAVANFIASGVLALHDKLGPMLWQLPPNLAFHADRMEEFLALLPRDTDAARALGREHDARLDGRTWLPEGPRRALRHAFEIRHPSFADPAFVALLRRHGAALVVADTASRWPLLEDVTADFVYVRLHGDEALYTSGYGDAALAGWARRISAWRHGGQVEDARTTSAPPPRAVSRRDVYCYFDNDVKVHAPFDAMRLAAACEEGTSTRPTSAPRARRLPSAD
ncbi:MAG TPA: DUF72 domain-containing protein [Burkholderiaceae bacterium]